MKNIINQLQLLGTGPTISRYQTPHGISVFRNLGIEVTSISCGQCHNLAITNNGVYAWGGSEYGQLGLGDMRESPNPELITTIAEEIVVEAVAGIFLFNFFFFFFYQSEDESFFGHQ